MELDCMIVWLFLNFTRISIVLHFGFYR